MKELQEQVKAQNEIINHQADEKQKLEKLPWYQEMATTNLSIPYTITTHVFITVIQGQGLN